MLLSLLLHIDFVTLLSEWSYIYNIYMPKICTLFCLVQIKSVHIFNLLSVLAPIASVNVHLKQFICDTDFRAGCQGNFSGYSGSPPPPPPPFPFLLENVHSSFKVKILIHVITEGYTDFCTVNVNGRVVICINCCPLAAGLKTSGLTALRSLPEMKSLVIVV